jgi:hypothetical protein
LYRDLRIALLFLLESVIRTRCSRFTSIALTLNLFFPCAFRVDCCLHALSAGLITAEQLLERFDLIQGDVERAFDAAVREPKVTSREALVNSNSAPLAPRSRTSAGGGGGNYSQCEYRSSPNAPLARPKRSVPFHHAPVSADTLSVAHGRDHPERIAEITRSTDNKGNEEEKGKSVDLNTMRKHMTRAYDELLSAHQDMVYIGEDVQHGGYYLVTEGLAAKHPLRCEHATSIGTRSVFS